MLLPGESHGWRSLAGYSPRGRKESDTTEQLHLLTNLPSGMEANGGIDSSDVVLNLSSLVSFFFFPLNTSEEIPPRIWPFPIKY